VASEGLSAVLEVEIRSPEDGHEFLANFRN
jgi:hypothetical protein